MKKATQILALLTISSLLFCACGAKDKSGRYPLDENEAVINDVSFNSDYVTDDNARVFYEIFVGSFSDSNGDGIGDLRGIINRFDYLNDGNPQSGKSLGVEGIWLTPIFLSPSYHKYDVTDYYTIDPTFGTSDDLSELIELCHSKNVKIILDLPFNHTSNLNSMFEQFVKAHKENATDNRYYSYYSYIGDGEIAPSGHTFNRISGTKEYYECNFSNDMPELNFDNADVRTEMLNVALHYLDLGIDGFRFDAAKYIYLGDNTKNIEFWDWYISELKEKKSDIFTVAEVWDTEGTVNSYYSAIDCFDFACSSHSGKIAYVARGKNASGYTDYVERFINSVSEKRFSSLFMPFIANHDMDRAAGYLSPSMGTMQMAANLYILGPGAPFIYYGEEIGIKGSRGGANTDANRRLAMLWGDSDTVKNPEGSTYSADNQIATTVSDQKADGDSLYSYYKRLIMIRTANPEIAGGSYASLDIPDSDLGGFISTWNGSSVCVIHNTTTNELTLDLSKVNTYGNSFTRISDFIGLSTAKLEGSVITIGPQTSAVLR